MMKQIIVNLPMVDNDGNESIEEWIGFELSEHWAITYGYTLMSDSCCCLTHRPSGLRCTGFSTKQRIWELWESLPKRSKDEIETEDLEFLHNHKALKAAVINFDLLPDMPENKAFRGACERKLKEANQ